jgi:hypothetical protein
MDNQPTPPNSASSERPAGLRPEDLQAAGPAGAEAGVGGAEVRPDVPGGGPAPAAGGPTALPPKLSPDDVAKALAAVPTPGPVKPSAADVPVPGAAADVDVIEPEWVSKAEDVVVKHQGDPYGEEEAIEELQEDYLQKRYGISVKEPGSDQAAK